MFEQRCSGLALIVCGVLTAVIADGDITAAFVLVPLGAWLLFTRERVFYSGKETRK